MAQYFLLKNGQQSGPLTQEQIDGMIQSRLFSGTETFRTDDSKDWLPISQLPGYVAAPPSAVPPPLLAPAANASGGNGCRTAAIVVAIVTVLMVVVVAMLAAIAVPNFLRARKRAQATQVMEDLRLIDSAIDQYSIEHNKPTGHPVEWTDIQQYLVPSSRLHNSGGTDILQHPFGPDFKVDELPKVPSATFNQLSDVAPPAFWEPYN